MAPGTQLTVDQAPMSAIQRIKSAKALSAAEKAGDANGSNGLERSVSKEYARGEKGQLEDLDRLAKLDWTQVRRIALHATLSHPACPLPRIAHCSRPSTRKAGTAGAARRANPVDMWSHEQGRATRGGQRDRP
jgi:hypothetical protein